MLALVDEGARAGRSPFHYVVAVAVIVADDSVTRFALRDAVMAGPRRNPFHNVGVTQIVIESRDDHLQQGVRRRLGQLDDRDRQTIRDFLRPWRGHPSFEWRGKEEPLLWLPDAIAGAVREHLDGHDSRWFKLLTANGVVPDVRIVP